jgi:hypothetical protein
MGTAYSDECVSPLVSAAYLQKYVIEREICLTDIWRKNEAHILFCGPDIRKNF